MISHKTVQLVFFRLHLVLHACAIRFDVTLWGENFWELNRPSQGPKAPGVHLVGRNLDVQSLHSIRFPTEVFRLYLVIIVQPLLSADATVTEIVNRIRYAIEAFG